MSLKKTLLLLLVAPLQTQALDLGVAGTTWPILEPDVRKEIVQSASMTSWSSSSQALDKSAKGYIASLPKHRYPSVKSPTLNWLDLSIELDRDINVPVKNSDGSYSWTQLAPKGTRINPLATKNFTQALFFFDGKDPEQVQLVKDLSQKEPLLIMFIEAGEGQVDTTAKALNKPIFYASDYMREQFHIQALPTLAFQGPAPKSHLMATIAFPQKTAANQVLYQWTNWPEWKKTFQPSPAKDAAQ